MKLSTELSAIHNIRLTDKHPNPKIPDLLVSDLSHKTNIAELTRDIDVVIHTAGEANNPTNNSDWLNDTTYGTYNLLRKKIKVETDIGLLIESLFLLPISIFLF